MSKKTKYISIYDTTLRDGSQGEGISFSLEDKLKIAKKLDELGFHYIEGGWPGSNPKDIAFFNAVKKTDLRHAKIAAFGSTRRAKVSVSKDSNIITLLEADTPVITIFGKSWKLHVTDVIRTDLKENLAMIFDSVEYLKEKQREVIYDAEHFFDGYKSDPEYTLRTIEAAVSAGADVICLCDTNGGTMPDEMENIVKIISRAIKIPLGIHIHNDAGMAVANSVIAVQSGCTQVQGTINGYGERCGNADLCEIIPNLKIKLGYGCMSDDNLKRLTELSHYVSEIANVVPRDNQPFVGKSAFAHKGGMHVNAVKKTSVSFEHIDPALVGNQRRILVSELSGRSNILFKAQQFGVDLEKETEKVQQILQAIKELENEGYQYESADGSLELLMKRTLGTYKEFFQLEGFRVIVERRGKKVVSEATIKLKVEGIMEHTASEGDGPVNALDNALRKALERFYPRLQEVHLVDYKVRVISGKDGTAAGVRVLIESADSSDEWETVGVSENIIEASWQALVDSIEYKLLKDKGEKNEK